MTIPPQTGHVPGIINAMPRKFRVPNSPLSGGGGTPPPTTGQLWPRKG